MANIATIWEFREFPIVAQPVEAAMAELVRDGWHFIGLHVKQSRGKPRLVALVRRLHADHASLDGGTPHG